VNKFSLLKTAGLVFAFSIAATIALYGQATFTSLVSFDGTNGANPNSSLIQGTDGTLYGTARFDGSPEANCGGGCGTAFKLTPGGALTVLYNFCSQAACADGAYPGGLVQSSDGNMYGITGSGGTGTYCTTRSSSTAGCGTVFSITPAGELTTLYSFCSQANCSDGYVGGFIAGLIQATNGSLFGTTYGGGANSYGTVFEITPTGTLTTLYSFCSETNCADGSYPYAALIQGNDGNFYGTTNGGGSSSHCTTTGGCGTVFSITPAGNLTTIYNFCNLQNCTDGTTPYSALAQGTDGNFYGTTYFGGANSSCPGNCGTVFKITPSGTLTTLYSFCPQTGCTDGFGPWAGLRLGTDGNFYGTTGYGGNTDGGASGNGIIFEVTPAGALTVLHSFDNTDGSGPFAQLVQATNGIFYGTTVYGGDLSCSSPNGCGTVFSLVARPVLSANPSAITISTPGSTGQTTLTVAGFSSNSISFSCGGLPSEATCSFGTPTFSGGVGTVALQIATTGSSMSSLGLPSNRNLLGQMCSLVFPGLIAIMIFLTKRGSRRRLTKMAAAIPMVLALVLGTACSGGSGSSGNSNSGTPTGNSTVTVTANAGGQSATLPITITVN
jgi:uncharacterized repeat protein (TIGR03803 family)